MGDPLLLALIASATSIVVALIGARQITGRRKAGDKDGGASAAKWKEQAELEKARADLLAERLSEEREAHAADLGTLERERTRLATTQHDLDDCSRQRDDAWSELRALQTAPARRRQRTTS